MQSKHSHREAIIAVSNVCLKATKRNVDNPSYLQEILPLIRNSFIGLSRYSDTETSTYIVSLIKSIADYFREHSLNREFLEYSDYGLTACNILKNDSSWLRLLRSDAYFALANWKSATYEANMASETAYSINPLNYARAILALGHLKTNQGMYKKALRDLTLAESLLTKLGDTANVAIAKKEIAACYLNRRQLHKALSLYLEAENIERQGLISGVTDHTVFMIGVVYRKLGKINQASFYLTDLLNRGEKENNKATIATASHHLAWLYLQKENITEAYRLAHVAKKLYKDIDDIRGISDADEQLGVIYMLEQDSEKAITYFKISFDLRLSIGNRPGAASSLKRIAQVHLHHKHWIKGVYYFFRSIWLYITLDGLNMDQLKYIFDTLRRKTKKS